MSQQFSAKEKLMWVRKYLDVNDKMQLVYEFYEFHQERYSNSKQRPCDIRGNIHKRLKIWVSKYHLGMGNLISKTGRGAIGRPTSEYLAKKKRSITELNDNDLRVYEDIIDLLLRKKGLTKEDVMEELIRRKKDTDNKAAMAGVFDVDRKVFYRHNTGRKYRVLNSDLGRIIEEVWKEYRKIHGYEKLFHILIARGYKTTKWQVRKHYEALNVQSIRFNKFTHKPKEAKNTNVQGENLIGQSYTGYQPNEKWFTDVSYIRLKSGRFIYLSLIIDSFANKVLHWELGYANDIQLVCKTLIGAIKKHGRPQIIHNDHGTPYLSREFIKLCNKLGIKRSLSGVGISLDNRPAEFVFGLIKHEHLLHQQLDSLETTYNELEDYIEFYNQKRIQSNLKNMSPEQYLSTYS